MSEADGMEVARVERQDVTPMQMLAQAVAGGMPVETIRELMTLKREWEAEEARKAFVAAMTKFKENPPQLVKNKHVKFQTSKGITEYDHATLDQVSGVIGQALSAHGITHRWEVDSEADKMRVSCILTHSMGHSERITLPPVSRDESGGKNSIQGLGSALTYAQRYSLLAITGLAVAETDDDGKGGGKLMSEAQKAGFEEEMKSLKNVQEWQLLWEKMTAATTECGDVATHDEFRSKMIARRKELK